MLGDRKTVVTEGGRKGRWLGSFDDSFWTNQCEIKKKVTVEIVNLQSSVTDANISHNRQSLKSTRIIRKTLDSTVSSQSWNGLFLLSVIIF